MREFKILVIGRSNVGKSSLINSLINNHSALVSDKIHSTRLSTIHSFIYNKNKIHFIDSPGTSINDNNLLSKSMKTNSLKYILESDLILLVTTPLDNYDHERALIDLIKSNNRNIVICINKTDLKNNSNKYLTEDFLNYYSIIEISATKLINLDKLMTLILKTISVKNNNKNFIDPSNDTNICQELIRESIIDLTKDELPYETAVHLLELNKSSKNISIKADIIVSKDNHKKIIIGKNGEMIKNIGIKSRKKIRKMLGKEIHLNLYVIVRDNWKNDAKILKELGYLK